MHAEFWNKRAVRYAAKPVADPDAFERKIAFTRKAMDKDDVVLDVGCGTGSLVLRLADAGREVHGVDASSGMINIARQKAEAAGVSNAHFHVAPFDEDFTRFAPASLDGVCAYSILHLMRDLEGALARVHDLLRPGGFFISSTVCIGESWVPLGAFVGAMRWMGQAPFVASLKKAELVRRLEAAGFVDIQMPDVGAKNTIAFIGARRADA